jgi:ADP-heptose:LPS heptosyltransferase
VVLSTAIVPALKEALPGVRIGMLVGSWSAPVVRNHPLLDWVHTVDHWKLSRAPTSHPQKFLAYWRTRRKALREIRELGYDCAVDLYFYAPNAITLLWQAGIPQRIGYTSGGFGPLLTCRRDFVLKNRSVVDYYLDLARLVPGADGICTETALPSLPRVPVDTTALAGGGKYIVLHLGSGLPLKEWPCGSWIELVRLLSAFGHRLVFTGSGAREREMVATAAAYAVSGVDLCDRLKWHEFVEVIASASLLVSVDSVAGHIAAAVRTPALVIGNGINNAFLWKPVGSLSQVVMKSMHCAPCYRRNGCAAMTCIRDVGAPQVLGRVADMLACRTASSRALST